MLARYGFWGGGRGSRKVCFCDFKNMYGCIYTSQGSCVAKSFKTRRGSTPQSKKNICGNTLRMSSRGKKIYKNPSASYCVVCRGLFLGKEEESLCRIRTCVHMLSGNLTWRLWPEARGFWTFCFVFGRYEGDLLQQPSSYASVLSTVRIKGSTIAEEFHLGKRRALQWIISNSIRLWWARYWKAWRQVQRGWWQIVLTGALINRSGRSSWDLDWSDLQVKCLPGSMSRKRQQQCAQW